jgi:hypothetical protein
VKHLPEDVRTFIQQVQQISQRDDYNLLLDPSLSPSLEMALDENPNSWCCSKHQQACLLKRSEHYEMRKLMLNALIQSECDRLEEYHTAIGFVSRYRLEFILHSLLVKSLGFYQRKNKENELKLVSKRLIDQCVMTAEEQQHQRIYSSQIARENPTCDLPLRAYSIQTFVKVVSHFILTYEMCTLLNKDPKEATMMGMG